MGSQVRDYGSPSPSARRWRRRDAGTRRRRLCGGPAPRRRAEAAPHPARCYPHGRGRV